MAHDILVKIYRKVSSIGEETNRGTQFPINKTRKMLNSCFIYQPPPPFLSFTVMQGNYTDGSTCTVCAHIYLSFIKSTLYIPYIYHRQFNLPGHSHWMYLEIYRVNVQIEYNPEIHKWKEQRLIFKLPMDIQHLPWFSFTHLVSK